MCVCVIGKIDSKRKMEREFVKLSDYEISIFLKHTHTHTHTHFLPLSLSLSLCLSIYIYIYMCVICVCVCVCVCVCNRKNGMNSPRKMEREFVKLSDYEMISIFLKHPVFIKFYLDKKMFGNFSSDLKEIFSYLTVTNKGLLILTLSYPPPN